MYQGKFSQKNRAQAKPEKKVVKPPVQSAPKAPEKEPEADILVREEPIQKAPVQEHPAKEAPVKEAPAQAAEKAPKKKKKAQAAPAEEKPAEKKKSKKKAKAKKKKGNRVISVIFYTLYFLMIIAFFGGMYFVMDFVEDWLVSYEASQPTTRSQEVFDEYFADPDWAEIYDLAGIESSAFEDKDDFVTYMEEKLSGAELTYMETSAGLSGDHKYNLKNGDAYIGYFTLTDKNAKAPGETTAQTPEDLAEELTALPDWQLGSVSVSFTRNEGVTIQKIDGHTAYVNGIAVSDDYTTQIASTVAEEYLPEGTTGFRLIRQTVSGLLLEPEVTIMDENGNPSTVIFDEETGIYAEQTEATTITAEEEEVVIDAAEAYGLFMIEKAGAANLAKYWKSSTDIYEEITTLARWFSGAKDYEFVDEKVTDYVRYNDKLFSARVSYVLKVTRKNDTVKDYNLDTTLFFEKQKSGKWMVIDMTNVDVQEQVAEVRITFLDANGNVASTDFVKDDISELFAPVLTVPNGQQFAGWFRETVDASGAKELRFVFTADESGMITVPAGTQLEPMVLQPVFEAASANTATPSESAESEAA